MVTPHVTETRRCGQHAPHWERHLTAGAAILPTYPSQVLARFVRAQAEYGDSWRTRPLSSFPAEAAEEGLDVGGWTMPFMARADELRPEVRGEALELAARLVALGAETAATAARLSALIRHAG